MQIIPLSEGAFTIDKTKEFVPFDLENHNLQERPVGSLLVEIQPFLLITSKDVLVLDTGLGFLETDGNLQLHKNLSKHGISASDVTKVLMTHLHKDHAGAMTLHANKEHRATPAFENAQYYINKDEFAFAFEKGYPSYHTRDFELFKNNDQVHFTEGNGVIDEYIKYEVTGAHSPWHQVFWIIEDGRKVFFGGDVAPQLQQMKSRFVAKYDFDGKKSMELRQHWWKQGQSEKWTFLFYHDTRNPIIEF